MPPHRPRTTSRAAWPRRSTARSSGRPTGSSSVSRPRREPSRSIGPCSRRCPDSRPADVPLVCLDTETTGLATAAGTLAWLIGVGWWEADRFRQVQLLLPDNGEERCLLAALEATIPASAWLVTYNGRGFDWPLLVARYRLARRAAPVHAGHLDLLPVVRRLFRHRMADARLRTAEAELLGLHRVGDVEGWEIPAATSSSSAAGRPGRSSTSSVTTTRTSARWLAC